MESRKDWEYITIYLPKEVRDFVKEYRVKNGIGVSPLIRSLLLKFMREDQSPTGRVGKLKLARNYKIGKKNV
jgi:hypothetical protein